MVGIIFFPEVASLYMQLNSIGHDTGYDALYSGIFGREDIFIECSPLSINT